MRNLKDIVLERLVLSKKESFNHTFEDIWEMIYNMSYHEYYLEDDELLQVARTDGNKEIVLGASNGKAIRFSESEMRDISRGAIGVRGIKLAIGEEIVGVGIIEK